MIPVVFYIGLLPIYSFGVMVASGVLLSLWLMAKKARRDKFPPGDMAFDMVFVSVLAGFLGARLYYVIQNFGWYAKHPLKIFAVWEGGLVFYGGMAGAFLGLWFFLRFHKIAFARGLDFILPYVSLTHAFGRVGCFLNGCCYGKACDLPWAVRFPELAEPVHPAQLYEAALDFLLFVFLSRSYDKKRFDGQIAALYFAGYAGIRFILEFFRAGNPVWGILTSNQWLSGVIFAAAVIFNYSKGRRGNKKEKEGKRRT